MTTLEDLDPRERVPEICEALEVSDDVEAEAIEFLETAMDEGLHVGKSPSGVAAGAVYAVSLLQNEKQTQSQVGETADVSLMTIRKRYQEQLLANGYDFTTRNDGDDDPERGTSPLSLARLPKPAREWVIRYGPVVISGLIALLLAWILAEEMFRQLELAGPIEDLRGTGEIEPSAPGLIDLYPLFGAIALAVMAWGWLANRLQNRRESP